MLEQSRVFFSFVFDYLMVIQIMAASASLLLAFEPAGKTARDIQRILLHFVLLFVVATGCNYLFFMLTYFFHGFLGVNFPLAWLVTIAFYLTFLTRNQLAGRIVTGTTIFTTVIAMADLGRQLMGVFSDAFPGGRREGFVLIAYVLIVVQGIVLRRYSLESYIDISRKTVLVTLLNAGIGIGIVFARNALESSRENQADIFYALVLAGIYLYSLLGYLMIYEHSAMTRNNNLLLVENRLLEADKQMLQISDQAMEDLRQMRHDIKNQYSLMQILLEEKRYEDLHKYFASMTGSKKDGNAARIAYIRTHNQLVDSIINMEITKAHTNGVRLVPVVEVPTELPFEESNLCRVIANLIDNAIEAESKVTGQERIVTCKLMMRNHYLYLGVTNDLAEGTDIEKLKSFTTTKSDERNHGIGHQIVKRIVENYGGYLQYTIENGQFIAEAMLEIAEE